MYIPVLVISFVLTYQLNSESMCRPDKRKAARDSQFVR